MLEEFEVGLEEVWERECRSNNDVDEVSLKTEAVTLLLVQSVVASTKSFKLRLEEPCESKCSSDSDATE